MRERVATQSIKSGKPLNAQAAEDEAIRRTQQALQSIDIGLVNSARSHNAAAAAGGGSENFYAPSAFVSEQARRSAAVPQFNPRIYEIATRNQPSKTTGKASNRAPEYGAYGTSRNQPLGLSRVRHDQDAMHERQIRELERELEVVRHREQANSAHWTELRKTEARDRNRLNARLDKIEQLEKESKSRESSPTRPTRSASKEVKTRPGCDEVIELQKRGNNIIKNGGIRKSLPNVNYDVLSAAVYSSAPGAFPTSLRCAGPTGSFRPSTIPVRTHTRYQRTMTLNNEIMISCNPTAYRPYTFVHTPNITSAVAFDGVNHPYRDDANVHNTAWTYTGSTTNGGAIAPPGNANPFLSGGHNAVGGKGVKAMFKGGYMVASITTSYDGLVQVVVSGTDENPRVHGRRQLETTAQFGIEDNLQSYSGPPIFGTPEPSVGGTVGPRYNDIVPVITQRAIGGSKTVKVFLPFPAAHHHFFHVDDQTDNETNINGFHVGSVLSCLLQGSGFLEVQVVGGSAILTTEMFVEHEVMVDDDSILMHNGSDQTRPVHPTDKHVGGWAGFGDTLKEAIEDSCNASLKYAVQKGSMTPTEAHVTRELVVKHVQNRNSSAAGVSAVAEKDSHSFLDNVLNTAASIASTVGDAALKVLEPLAVKGLSEIGEMALAAIL